MATYNDYLKELKRIAGEHIAKLENEIKSRHTELEKLRQENDNLSKELEMQKQYNHFIQLKKWASTEKEYQTLAQQFGTINGYKDSAELASECDKQYCALKERREEEELEAKYNNLVQLKNKASTENEFQVLFFKFSDIFDYKDSLELRNECNKQYCALKERRLELEAEEKRQQEEREVAVRRQQEQKQQQELEERQRLERKEKVKKNMALYFGLLGGLFGGFIVAYSPRGYDVVIAALITVVLWSLVEIIDKGLSFESFYGFLVAIIPTGIVALIVTISHIGGSVTFGLSTFWVINIILGPQSKSK